MRDVERRWWAWKLRERLHSTPGPRYCAECGASNPPDATYCGACGKRLAGG